MEARELHQLREAFDLFSFITKLLKMTSGRGKGRPSNMTIPPPSDIRAHLLNFTPEERDSIATDNHTLLRLFPFNRFVDIVRNNELVFVNPSKWEDPYENLLRDRLITDSTGARFTCPAYENSYYAQCWFLPPESDGMWRIYSPEMSGVLVECGIAKLHQSIVSSIMHPLQQLYIGRIRYFTENEFKSLFEDPDFLQSVVRTSMYGPGGTEPLLLKRDAFAHEKEVQTDSRRPHFT